MKYLKIIIPLVLSLIIIPFLYLNFYISQKTNTPFLYFAKTAFQSYLTPTIGKDFTVLILGIDPRNDVLEKTNTTDTIILARYKNGSLNLISIPRDLWIQSLEVKVNQIYPMAVEKEDKYAYLSENFYKFTGILVDRIIVINTQNLSNLVDIIGPLEVFLDEGFRDDQYPNPEYIANPFSGASKYITVEFNKGINEINGKNIQYFVRSRKSLTGGTDLGRIKRQQLVIDAIFKKVKTPEFRQNSSKVLSIYSLWKKIETNFSDSDIFSFLIHNYRQLSLIQIAKHEIPVSEYNTNGLIYHPTNFYRKQWVYIPRDPSLSELQGFFKTSLN